MTKSKVGTRTVPLCMPTNSAMLTEADSSTALAMSNVTEAGSGVVSEQRNGLIATTKFICAEIQKRKGYKKGDCKLKRIKYNSKSLKNITTN